MIEVVREAQVDDSQSRDGRWAAVIYNNATNTFEEVIHIVMVATQCEVEEAFCEVWEADQYGKAPVHFASKEECNRVASIVSSIGVKTEVEREWSE